MTKDFDTIKKELDLKIRSIKDKLDRKIHYVGVLRFMLYKALNQKNRRKSLIDYLQSKLSMLDPAMDHIFSTEDIGDSDDDDSDNNDNKE